MKKRTFDNIKHKHIDTPKELEDFFRDIKEICKKYNLSIAHEDSDGGNHL